jgi:hypothetical protein
MFGSAIGTLFALVFALVTIAVWNNYDHVNAAVGAEANALHNIYRDLESYPTGFRQPVQALLRAYVKEVVEVEWPMLPDGKEDLKARQLLAEIGTRIASFRPAALGDLPLQEDLLAQLSTCRSLRDDRIRASTNYLDTPMWISLVAGSLILLCFCAIWRMPALHHQLMLCSAMGASLAVLFFLMMAYNNPFTHPAAIQPTPLQDLLDHDWAG